MMVGHGRPNASCESLPRTGQGWLGPAWCCAPILLVLWLAAVAQAGDSIRVRIAWGGSVARLWQGSVTLTEGTLSELEPLGIEADEAGSMWLDGREIVVRERSPRLYDGFDVLVDAPVGQAKLRVRLAAENDTHPPVVIEAPLADILDNSVMTDLDQQGTRLLIRRSPGDALRVQFDRRNLIFSPGESFSIRVRPNLVTGSGGAGRRLRVQLRPARSDEVLWEQQSPVEDDQTVPVPLQVNEGVYDVVFSILETPAFQLPSVGAVPLRLKKKAIAERKVQLLVLDRAPPAPPAAPETLRMVEEIDPTSGKWWEKFAKPPSSLGKLTLGKWPRLWQGPLGSGDLKTRQHALGKLAELNPSNLPGDVSWEAYTVPIAQPGKPHVLEVEYPSDVPQQLGISVLEPNSADSLLPIQLDSGVSLAEEIVAAGDAGPRMLRHRLVFWPHTAAPLVLITNQSSTRPAVYGKIRVLDGWSRMPARNLDATPTAGGAEGGRLLGAYFDRPLFPESVCATEAFDDNSRRSLDDWLTFHQGGTRLVEYLRHAGMNAAMISVFAEGGSLYPSPLTGATPRYDKGSFFDSGQDPVRKDVLEMLLRLFDRNAMRLIPAIELASPLPELETMLRAGGSESEGIRWIGPDGVAWDEVYRSHRRMAPYYNLLHPRVQAAVLRVVRELADRYARDHESFAGVAVQLAGYGYGQLPGPDWGMDDATIVRFEQETGFRVPAAEGPGRFARRHAFLTGPGRRAWMKWRSDCLGRFYRRVQAEISAVRPEARLYLTTANLLSGAHWETRLQPTLSRPATMDELLLEAGIDASQFREPSGPVLVLARRVAPSRSADTRAMELVWQELLHEPKSDDPWTSQAALCFQPSSQLRIESFDAKSPYRPSYTVLHSQLVPSSEQNRRRFIRALAACDAQAIFDGGQLLPMGQEDALADLAAAYRRLPAVVMERLKVPVSPSDGRSTTAPGGADPAARQQNIQPVTIRHGSHGGKTYVYAINESPVPVSLGVRVGAPPGSRIEPLVEGKSAGTLTDDRGAAYWRVDLAPYDLVAARFDAPGITFSSPEVAMPGGVRESLATFIRGLGDRLGDLRIPPLLETLSNARFEEPAGAGGAIPGWIVQKEGNADARLHRDAARSHGPQVARLVSSGADVALLSKPFSPPPTGRLSMLVWLRVPSQQPQPSVELVFEGRLNGEPFSRSGLLGRAINGPTKPILEEWRPFLFPVTDLPLDGLTNLQVGVRLRGPGEVWVDDFELRHLEFTPDELRQLSRMLSSAETKLETNEISDCLRLLEGYWPCFLERNVPLRTSVARRPDPKAASPNNTAPRQPESTGLMDRVRKMVPRKLW